MAGIRDITLNRRATWWGLLAIYAVLFLVTGYFAFIGRDVNPALRQGLERLSTAQQVDDDSKAVLLDMLQQEANEHNKKESLALQSFNVVLGALLGFLAASAVSRPPATEP